MRKLIPSWIRIPVAFLIIFAATEYFVDSGEKPAFMEYTAVQLFLILVLLILIAIEGVIGALENVMLHKLDEEAKARFLAEKELGYKFTWVKETYIKLLGQKPIEQEAEIVLDHNYDGIKELDNNLPPWWVYAFYISIIFAIGYMLKYEVFNGDNQIDELETELAEARIAIEEYKKTAKDLVDFNTVTLLTEASDLKAGKTIFESNCVACHMADGGGGIGPNLTDKNWILGGDIKHVFKTVSEGGRSGKGMIAWKAQLKPAQIAQVSSYVLSLQGTTPANPKEPQGDIWTPEGDAATEVN
ncbi:cbb3-type cytochrome c oxidase N-terminal domain-containing protein [Algibacter lectus]|uniref:Cytochrome c oxidase cbb3-type subunit 3 n=1 Tax=Algibacter lectus TaxID=221126 RepID=A0A090VN15_9FLAO|nr:cbb3-type cytochrome c oxidase N-terminal domain-containing protein [Algibacter lectus]MWW24784.1 c-type cytochrome [Algibacter lectus]TDY64805.1 cytochrome c oxidase cbb3-type subunit 3 [Algibacter lectus]SFD26195.1 cytochrome c oxidase cbb3-type subunit 3 [Algibacter lectus]GAL64729.1 cytochrome c oxidase subunit CcoP [Algibacter lectus]GAL81758.1 cytochrome c oxidase subunit CcoP [Algibacter lectus]